MADKLLLLAQVDDVSGEVLQDVAERLHAAGAYNIQVLASLGKKGRPGHVLLVDIDAAREDDVAIVLGLELGAWGYRVLESRHRHFDITRSQRRVRIASASGDFEHTLGCKHIRKGDRLLGFKVEHADLVSLRDALDARGEATSLSHLRAAVETALRIASAEDIPRVRLAAGDTTPTRT